MSTWSQGTSQQPWAPLLIGQRVESVNLVAGHLSTTLGTTVNPVSVQGLSLRAPKGWNYITQPCAHYLGWSSFPSKGTTPWRPLMSPHTTAECRVPWRVMHGCGLLLVHWNLGAIGCALTRHRLPASHLSTVFAFLRPACVLELANTSTGLRR